MDGNEIQTIDGGQKESSLGVPTLKKLDAEMKKIFAITSDLTQKIFYPTKLFGKKKNLLIFREDFTRFAS